MIVTSIWPYAVRASSSVAVRRIVYLPRNTNAWGSMISFATGELASPRPPHGDAMRRNRCGAICTINAKTRKPTQADARRSTTRSNAEDARRAGRHEPEIERGGEPRRVDGKRARVRAAVDGVARLLRPERLYDTRGAGLRVGRALPQQANEWEQFQPDGPLSSVRHRRFSRHSNAPPFSPPVRLACGSEAKLVLKTREDARARSPRARGRRRRRRRSG